MAGEAQGVSTAECSDGQSQGVRRAGEIPIARDDRHLMGGGNGEVQRIKRQQREPGQGQPVPGLSVVRPQERPPGVQPRVEMRQEERLHPLSVGGPQLPSANLPGNRRRQLHFNQVADRQAFLRLEKALDGPAHGFGRVVGGEEAGVNVDQARASRRARKTSRRRDAPRTRMEARKGVRSGSGLSPTWSGTSFATGLPRRTIRISSPAWARSSISRSFCLVSLTVTVPTVASPLEVYIYHVHRISSPSTAKGRGG